MLKIKEVKEHLSSRPIGVVFKKLSDDEKSDENSLKFMCVVDVDVERNDLYRKIAATNSPKLLHQLLGFPSYRNFTYYEYQDDLQLIGKNLQCCKCELFGPYSSVLTHMATNHHVPIGNILCAYCGKVELKKHFDDGSLGKCYENYLKQKDISYDSQKAIAMHKVIKEFYDRLKDLSVYFGVHVRRQMHCYAGKGRGKPVKVNAFFDDDDEEATCSSVQYRRAMTKKNISYDPKKKLDQAFENGIVKMCGGDALCRFIVKPESNLEFIEDNPAPMQRPTSRRGGQEEQASTSDAANNSNKRSSSISTESDRRTAEVNQSNPYLNYLGSLLDGVPEHRRDRTKQRILDIATDARSE